MRAIVTVLKGPGLGDFLGKSLAAALMKIKAPDCRVYAVAHPASREQAESLLLNPFIDHLVYAPSGVGSGFFTECWYRQHAGLPADLLAELADAPIPLCLGQSDYVRVAGDAPGQALFRVPDAIAEDARRQLAGLGLDPRRWYACLHMREAGYRRDGRLHPRTVRDLEPYLALIRHIVEVQGGQVVRLGDPSMTPLPAMDGLVDLARLPSSFLLQAFAVSRARYLVGSDSGPCFLAFLFDVPTATANAVSGVYASFLAREHIVCTKTFVLDDGRRVRDREAAELGLTFEHLWHGRADRLEENDAATLVRLADAIAARSPADPWPADPWPVREPPALGQGIDRAWFDSRFMGPPPPLERARFLSDC